MAPQPIPVSGTKGAIKLDVHHVGDGSGLAGKDEAGLTVLGLEDVARPHVDLAEKDGAHARAAMAFAARMGYVDAHVEQHIDESRLSRPIDAMPLTVEFHIS